MRQGLDELQPEIRPRSRENFVRKCRQMPYLPKEACGDFLDQLLTKEKVLLLLQNSMWNMRGRERLNSRMFVEIEKSRVSMLSRNAGEDSSEHKNPESDEETQVCKFLMLAFFEQWKTYATMKNQRKSSSVLTKH